MCRVWSRQIIECCLARDVRGMAQKPSSCPPQIAEHRTYWPSGSAREHAVRSTTSGVNRHVYITVAPASTLVRLNVGG
jgi:hypothetical protein